MRRLELDEPPVYRCATCRDTGYFPHTYAVWEGDGGGFATGWTTCRCDARGKDMNRAHWLFRDDIIPRPVRRAVAHSLDKESA